MSPELDDRVEGGVSPRLDDRVEGGVSPRQNDREVSPWLDDGGVSPRPDEKLEGGVSPWFCSGLSGADVGEGASLNEHKEGSDEDVLSAHLGRSFGGLRSDGEPVLRSFFGIVSALEALRVSSVLISLVSLLLRQSGVLLTSTPAPDSVSVSSSVIAFSFNCCMMSTSFPLACMHRLSYN